MNKKCAVISMGVGQKFALGLKRLEAGLKANEYHGDYHLFDAYPPGCPHNADVPKAFKPWLFQWARDLGYSLILWMDASCVPVKRIDVVFEKMRRYGYVMPYEPFRVADYCSDNCLAKMGLSRKQIQCWYPSVWTCVLGLDLDSTVGAEFLEQWYARSLDGSFLGDFTNERGQVSSDLSVKGFRHDQTVAAILAWQRGLCFDWDIVAYDILHFMPLIGYENKLQLRAYPTPILINHLVKTKKHSRGDD